MPPIENRVRELEIKTEHLIAGLGDEKAAREKTTTDIEDYLNEEIKALATRVRDLEKTVWVGTGIIIACQVLLKLIL